MCWFHTRSTAIVAALAMTSVATAETHMVMANSMSFSPAAIDVSPGDTIVWQHNSGYPHTVTSGIPCKANGMFHGDLVGGDDTFTWDVPMDASGDISYFCVPLCNMGMHGMITVVGPEVLNVPEDYKTIQGAIDAASDGDTIMIAAGNYPPGEDGFYLVEDTAVSFIGETNADGSPAVILGGALAFNGQGTSQIFVENMKMESLALYDCTADVTNCYMVEGHGDFAGVLINQAQGTLRNCRIADGDSDFFPGGVFMTAQMEDAEILENDVDFIDCVIENNTGGCPVFGCSSNAGVRIENGIVDFVGCSIRYNYASGYGGISMASQAVVSLTDTTVCGNSSPGQINGNWTDNGGNVVADECPPDCLGDLDGDGVVGGGDLGLLLAAWGTDDPEADLNGDGTVSGADLGLLLSYWGGCSSP